MEYHIDNISFSGPLDLLLDLIKRSKYEIKDVIILDIINQYLKIIEVMSESDLEVVSEFIVMAASLMEIKSRYFIFINDSSNEDDPGKELIDMLETYRYFKDIADIMKDMYNDAPSVYRNKKHETFTEDVLDLSKCSANDILKAYLNLSKKEEQPKPQIVSFKKISVDEKIREIEKILTQNANIYFDKILNSNEKDEVVATLLGVLELAKDQRVEIYQKQIFKDILIERLYSI
ncbi:MAG: segregation/condensation protein A [Proteocatella sp.]